MSKGRVKVARRKTESEYLFDDLMAVRYDILDQKPLGQTVRNLEAVLRRLQTKNDRRKRKPAHDK